MNNRNKKIDSGSGDNRRMYDCDICMRGFTNPQALGGHRNIHRKERERNLSSSSSSSSSSSRSFPFSISSSQNYSNSNYNNPPPYFPINEPSYHHQTFQPPVNPSYNAQRFGAAPSSGGGNYGQGEFLGLDLSLRLGSVDVGNDSNRRLSGAGDSKPDDQDDDLDLDLSLGGHHHHH